MTWEKLGTFQDEENVPHVRKGLVEGMKAGYAFERVSVPRRHLGVFGPSGTRPGAPIGCLRLSGHELFARIQQEFPGVGDMVDAILRTAELEPKTW
jgi:hypothetical protein